MSYVNRKRMAVVPARLAAWTLLAIAAAAFAFGLALSSPLTAMADEGGLAAAPLATQDDHGAVLYGPWYGNSDTLNGGAGATDEGVTLKAAIYEDGCLLIECANGATEATLPNVATFDDWKGLLPWTATSGRNISRVKPTAEMNAIFSVDFGEGVDASGMDAFFAKMTNLTQVKEIPEGATTLVSGFRDCSSLASAPAIPNSVTALDACFYGCTSLVSGSVIPKGVSNMQNCFNGCTSLVFAPDIPNTVTNLNNCFYGCIALEAGPSIEDGVENLNMTQCFQGCSALASAPDIPEGVTNMISCFRDCTSLIVAPKLPSTVQYLDTCFCGCEALVALPEGWSFPTGAHASIAFTALSHSWDDPLVTYCSAADYEALSAAYNWAGDRRVLAVSSSPDMVPTVTSADPALGSATAEFVGAGGYGSWVVKGVPSNDWAAFDRVEDAQGNVYASEGGKEVRIPVSENGQVFIAHFRSTVDPLYNETDAESVKIAFTISNDGVPLAGNDGESTPLARVEEEIPYFDLSLYGLERYNRYHTAYGWGGYSDEEVVKRPTALHAFIWLTERYYIGLSADECGKGTSGVLDNRSDTEVRYLDGTLAYRSDRKYAILPTQEPTSLFMTNFWGHDLNLMYFVNHGFPMMTPGTGATCDYVLLEDGDSIDVGLFSWWDFRLEGGFCRFDADSYYAIAGDELSVSTFKAGTAGASEGNPAGDESITALNVAAYDEQWNKVADLAGEGVYSYTFETPGIYYLMGSDPNAKNPEAANFAPAIAKVTVAGEPEKDDDGCYLLGSASDMAWFQDYVNAKGHYDAKGALVADIDMSSLKWAGLGDEQGFNPFDSEMGIHVDRAFSGTFDGRGHTLTVAFEGEPFVTLLAGTVKDLTLEGTCAAPAAFAKYATYGAALDSCVNGCDVSRSMVLSGMNNSSLSAGLVVMVLKAQGTVPSTEEKAIRIIDCTNRGTVASDATSSAGIVALIDYYLPVQQSWGRVLTLEGCTNDGDIVGGSSSADGSGVSGIVGSDQTESGIEIVGCRNNGNLCGKASSAAGIGGGATIRQCMNAGNFFGSFDTATGIGGWKLVEKCANTGNVKAQKLAGGICGNLYDCEVRDCYNLGDVSVTGENGVAGGIAARMSLEQVPNTSSYVSSPITNCYTTGAVSGQGDVGAVLGRLYEFGYYEGEGGAYSSARYSDVQAYWLEGSAEKAIGMVGAGCEQFDKTQMKTVAEMRYDALLGELGEAFQASCPYPALAWQEAAEHSWGEGTVAVEPTIGAEGEMTFECTVCGETKTEVLPKVDASDIQAAIDAAKAIDTSALTDEQKADLEAAIAAAEAAAGDEGTTTSQLDAALAALELQTAKADAAVARAEAAAAQQAAIDAAKSACEAAGIDYDPNKSPADNVAAANAAQQAALGVANVAAEDAAKKACEAAGVEYDPTKSPAENVVAANDAQQAKLARAEKAAEAAEARAIAAETAQKAAEAAAAGLKANPMKATGKTIKAKAKKKTRAAKAKAFQVEDAKGKVSFYKAKGNDKIAVKANGKVIVKKGLKRGKTYKVKVLVVAEGDKEFAPAFKTVILKVKVAKK